MPVVMKIHGLANGHPTPMDGQYVMHYSLTAHKGRGSVLTTPDPEKAIKWPKAIDAMLAWREVAPAPHDVRPDGEPNRPLTAFSVEIVNPDAWKGIETDA